MSPIYAGGRISQAFHSTEDMRVKVTDEFLYFFDNISTGSSTSNAVDLYFSLYRALNSSDS